MTLFRLDASIRRVGSVSREIADAVERAWLAEHPGDPVVRRDVGAEPLPADAWVLAAARKLAPGSELTAPQRDAAALAARLADELIDADAAVVAAPLYNYSVSQHLKSWIDVLVTDPRLAPGAEQPLAGKPLALVVARGGGYGPGTPKEGWDHGTPWLLRIFADVFGMDVRLVPCELTLADVNPAMETLRPRAAEVRREAME
ncbi:FMN-dependent NADH-azoreductase, partial [Pseudonocardia nigra]|uniref:FMN-dependent NADH-azoreductase n=1 Tax=Pseudonocardia nigra TaxID=1921578 RepID=UPI001C5D7C05